MNTLAFMPCIGRGSLPAALLKEATYPPFCNYVLSLKYKSRNQGRTDQCASASEERHVKDPICIGRGNPRPLQCTPYPQRAALLKHQYQMPKASVCSKPAHMRPEIILISTLTGTQRAALRGTTEDEGEPRGSQMELASVNENP